jgi:hypothetical protein
MTKPDDRLSSSAIYLIHFADLGASLVNRSLIDTQLVDLYPRSFLLLAEFAKKIVQVDTNGDLALIHRDGDRVFSGPHSYDNALQEGASSSVRSNFLKTTADLVRRC